MTETEAARRRAINRIGTYLPWRRDWQPRDTDEYHRALDDLTPDAVEEAVTEAMRTRRTVPSASQLREIHAEREEARRDTARAERANVNRGDGAGCPSCRKEYPVGSHAYWAGDGHLIACSEHNFMWHGTTYRDDHDPGDLAPGEWRTRALNGEYGETLRALAERGTNPADVIPAITPPNLDDALRQTHATTT